MFADGSQLKELGGNSFFLCENLKTITLPVGLETIGKYCFYDSGLIEIIIPNSVKKVEKYAFSCCSDLKKVVLPEGLKTIPEACFWQSGLEEIRIPESVKTI